jgi:hypothetical protein
MLNAQLAQWATALHLPLDTLRQAVAEMEKRILTGAPVIELDCTTLCPRPAGVQRRLALWPAEPSTIGPGLGDHGPGR